MSLNDSPGVRASLLFEAAGCGSSDLIALTHPAPDERVAPTSADRLLPTSPNGLADAFGPLKTAAEATEKEVQDTYGSNRGIGGTVMKRLRVR